MRGLIARCLAALRRILRRTVRLILAPFGLVDALTGGGVGTIVEEEIVDVVDGQAEALAEQPSEWDLTLARRVADAAWRRLESMEWRRGLDGAPFECSWIGSLSKADLDLVARMPAAQLAGHLTGKALVKGLRPVLRTVTGSFQKPLGPVADPDPDQGVAWVLQPVSSGPAEPVPDPDNWHIARERKRIEIMEDMQTIDVERGVYRSDNEVWRDVDHVMALLEEQQWPTPQEKKSKATTA